MGKNYALKYNGYLGSYIPYTTITRPAQVTVEAWFYADANILTGYQKLVSCTDAGGYQLCINSELAKGYTSFIVSVASSYKFCKFPKTEIPMNQYNHLVGVFDGLDMYIYLNGVMKATTSVSTSTRKNISYVSKNLLCIGCEPNGGSIDTTSSYAFTNIIDEVRIWNYARYSPAATMRKKLIGNEAGLVGYWRLDEGAGSMIYDSSPYGSHGYSHTGTWVVSGAPISYPKYLIKQNNIYYSIDYLHYDTSAKTYMPLTLTGGATPNIADINNYALYDTAAIANPTTINGETFKPIDKFTNNFKVIVYK